jgi:hypothetical protein
MAEKERDNRSLILVSVRFSAPAHLNGIAAEDQAMQAAMAMFSLDVSALTGQEAGLVAGSRIGIFLTTALAALAEQQDAYNAAHPLPEAPAEEEGGGEDTEFQA